MTRIEWCEATWNPVVGCSVVSPGCTNCYAMRQAHRLAANPATPHYAGTIRMSRGGPVWTGRVALASARVLTAPLRRRTPTTWFVNSMGDLFHEDVPDEWIDRVFAVMALCPQHIFQVLTKRADRMRDYMDLRSQPYAGGVDHWLTHLRPSAVDVTSDPHAASVIEDTEWPLPNVWLGVSAEDQTRADQRIPHLLATPAAIRFVSAEPLLGPINMLVTDYRGHDIHALRGIGCDPTNPDGPDEYYYTGKLDWVICGGESGRDARPMHPGWARALRDQCQAANVPFFMKQWGEWGPVDGPIMAPIEHGARVRDHDGRLVIGRGPTLPPDILCRVGKRAAGRLLDGREWNEVPGGRL